MTLKKNDKNRVAIVAGLRTPFLKQATGFKNSSALELGAMVVNELVNKLELDKSLIEQCVFGQVIQMPSAPNIAREIVLATDMHVSTDAYSVSRACATSFQSTVNIAQAIALGDISVGIAGGADSSSVLPIGVSKRLASTLLQLSKMKKITDKLSLLSKLKLSDLKPVPPAIAEYSTSLSMGQTAEQMAKTFGITREQQDEYAHHSHLLATKAWMEGKLSQEVMSVFPEPYNLCIEKDNCIRESSILAQYANLSPVFDKAHGSVTAANSSPLTDGASALLLMSEGKAQSLGYEVLGYIRSYAFTAIDVWQDMLMGPSYATPLALKKAGMTLSDIDLIEMHEAFSSQVLANLQAFSSVKFAKEQLGLTSAIGDMDLDKFNVLGGSLAYGHPFAATGTRLIMQLLNELKRRGGGTGLATACAAGGLGAAMIVETE